VTDGHEPTAPADGLVAPGFGEVLPGLLRVVRDTTRRTIEFGMETTFGTVRQVARSVAEGAPPGRIVAELTAPTVALVRDLLVILGRAEPDDPMPVVHRRPGATVDELRAKGAQLLYDSADVWFEGDTHPAYARILEELSPDEARILRFLALEGPQPAVDIRTSRPLGVGSELVAGGLSMVGLQAGVRNQARTNADLNNLYRLGLVWFSREQVTDPSTYQVVEVQPDVVEAIRRAGRAHRSVRRSIELTPFGEDFCRTCLPLGDVTP
jgi:hypothetical protein